ncbi:type IV pilus biogenesis protein PilM [Pseudoduganella lutea]|uniref:Agglutinin biogenesis protein MshI n=1 Tax=Pseudoduganella lutea TaxID=321985 RepID=A0A4P6L4X2_9BURK|nr:pilus assembly protein PilM [Pseudoduganella lutea]QBE66661.1 agglutinin biogenesis protein MshI [Pseudoduganella lutea]
MGLFSRARKQEGVLVVTLSSDGIQAVVVRTPVLDKPAAMVKFAAAEPAERPAALEKLGKELGASRYRGTTLLLPGEYQLLSVEAPNVPQEEVRTAVRWRLKDMIDFPIDEATVDFLDIPVDRAATAQTLSLFAVAARNSLVSERQRLFHRAGFRLAVIDIPELAQRNVSALLEREGRGQAMLSFDSQGGLLTISYQGELYLARRIDITLEQLRDAPEERRQATYDRITLELQRSLDNFERQFHFITTARLTLAPTGVAGLFECLAENLYIPVDQLDLTELFDLTGLADAQDPVQQQQCFLALGAALRVEEVKR